ARQHPHHAWLHRRGDPSLPGARSPTGATAAGRRRAPGRGEDALRPRPRHVRPRRPSRRQVDLRPDARRSATAGSRTAVAVAAGRVRWQRTRWPAGVRTLSRRLRGRLARLRADVAEAAEVADGEDAAAVVRHDVVGAELEERLAGAALTF